MWAGHGLRLISRSHLSKWRAFHPPSIFYIAKQITSACIKPRLGLGISGFIQAQVYIHAI